MPNPKTIMIFLPDGNPSGIKIVEVSNRNIRAFLVPRAKLSEAKRPELNQPALYVLCDREGESAYIGECENFFNRVKDHDQKKDFWELAIVFVAKDNSLEKGDVRYLESLAVEQASIASRMTLINANVPARNNLHEFKTATINEFFEDVQLLITALGYPLFDQINTDAVAELNTWYCRNNMTEARAIYNEQGFTVLAGSLIDGHDRPAFLKKYPSGVEDRREMLAANGEIDEAGKNVWTLTKNITFTSPNKAARFCVGGSINAWIAWKNLQGATMDSVMRRAN